MSRLPGRRPTTKDRAELLEIWDTVSPEARKMIFFVARAVARREGVVGPDASLFPEGRRWKRRTIAKEEGVLGQDEGPFPVGKR